jgi:uncharacterized surface protein with fasciclin (FAS1) repeats
LRLTGANRSQEIAMNPMPSTALPRRNALLALGVFGAFGLSACNDDDHPNDVLRQLEADPDTRVLADAVNAAGLASALSGAGPITLFAPTNAAFAALLTELGLTQAQLFANTSLLRAVLGYHLLDSRVPASQVPLGRPISSGGGVFKIESFNGVVEFTDGRNRRGRLSTVDIATDNGVIHKLDRVMLPADKNLVQTAQSLPDFSILVEAVVAADLVGTLTAAGPLTVFAPTNTAFAGLLAELGLSKEQLLANRALLTSVLTYHVLPRRVLRAEVPVGAAIATAQGESFSVDNGLTITDRNGRRAAIITTDLFASNGVIHVIDKVILPKIPNIVELAQSQPQFSILVEAVVAAGLASTLSGPTALTVFAPTNDAFAALLTELGTTKEALLANTSLLTSVLTYHVLAGRVYRAGVPINTPISTLQGGTFRVGSDLRITDARNRNTAITSTDLLAINGVVHVIDRVILP